MNLFTLLKIGGGVLLASKVLDPWKKIPEIPAIIPMNESSNFCIESADYNNGAPYINFVIQNESVFSKPYTVQFKEFSINEIISVNGFNYSIQASSYPYGLYVKIKSAGLSFELQMSKKKPYASYKITKG